MIYVFIAFVPPRPTLSPGLYLKFVIENFVNPLYLDLGCLLHVIYFCSSIKRISIQISNYKNKYTAKVDKNWKALLIIS